MSSKIPPSRTQALREAIDKAGGRPEVARKLNITLQAVWQWKEQCPALRVLDLERISNVSRHELREDLYPVEERQAS